MEGFLFLLPQIFILDASLVEIEGAVRFEAPVFDACRGFLGALAAVGVAAVGVEIILALLLLHPSDLLISPTIHSLTSAATSLLRLHPF